LASLWFLLYLRDGGRRSLVLSGLAFGLAVATKVPTVLLAAPLLLCVVMVETGRWPGFTRRGLRTRGWDLTVWGLIALAAMALIWPALWVRPLSLWLQFRADLASETRVSALRVYDTTWDFYGRVLAWRFTPLMQGGALIGVISLAWPAWRRRQPRWPELEALAITVVVMIALLRLSGELAYDRYLLPAVPFVALLSGAGWDLARRLYERSPRIATLVPAAVLTAQLFLFFPHFPECLTFYNPLLGGPAGAATHLLVGQGEGLDRAASFLNGEPGAADRTIAAPGFAPALAPYLRGRTVDSLPASRDGWLDADRVVLYHRQVAVTWPDPVLVAYVTAQRRPLYTVRLHGLDYVRVFAGPIAVPPELAAPMAGNSKRSSEAPPTAASMSPRTSSASSARDTSSRVAAVAGLRGTKS
jgi:hypothetical protein